MRNKRAKIIRKKIKNNDEQLITDIRKNIGPQATLFNKNRLYKWAKKLWTQNKI